MLDANSSNIQLYILYDKRIYQYKQQCIVRRGYSGRAKWCVGQAYSLRRTRRRVRSYED